MQAFTQLMINTERYVMQNAMGRGGGVNGRRQKEAEKKVLQPNGHRGNKSKLRFSFSFFETKSPILKPFSVPGTLFSNKSKRL